AGARAQARRLDSSGLLRVHRRGDPLREQEGDRGPGLVPRPSAALTPEARLADHIPDPGRHRTHFYAHYANRVRGERPGEGEPCHAGEAEPPPRRRCSSTWARLVAQGVPGGSARLPTLRRAAQGGGLHNRCAGDPADPATPRPQPPEKPPPEISDVVRVPVDDEGREIDLKPLPSAHPAPDRPGCNDRSVIGLSHSATGPRSQSL